MYNTDLPTRAELPSTGKLLRSTAIAALIATGLLVITILPAEYGIDPTGAGRALGLTQMGEIKISLATEANAGEAPPAGSVAPVAALLPPAAVAVAPAPAPHGHGHGHEHEHSAAVAPVVTSRSEPAAAEMAPARQHTVTISLKPGEAAEIKLTMQKDASVRYEWSTVGGQSITTRTVIRSKRQKASTTATARARTKPPMRARCKRPSTASTAGSGVTARQPRSP